MPPVLLPLNGWGGVRVVVLMKRVAVGRAAGGVDQAVGIRSRRVQADVTR